MAEPGTQRFDYVIVGGGSAGSVLAARLSQDPAVSVCLLEAGGSGKSLLVRMPGAAVAMVPGWGKINNWAYETVPQPGLNGRRGYQPRGRALGGSSAINAMLYVRGHRSDYDDWADLGCAGWSWDEVLPYFKRSENQQHGGDDEHGGDGPLHVADQQSPRLISRAFVQAGTQLQHRQNDDFNRGDNEGIGLYQVTQFHDRARAGERCSAAAAYLHPVMQRPNLTVITHAHATRILFDGKRATGVAYRQNREAREVMAAREVILCGGAFNSPQLLQLSGVGRPEDITPHGIAMLHALPGVGQNLQDHLDFILGFTTRESDTYGIGLASSVRFLGHLVNWWRDGSGMMATPFAEAGAFLKSDKALERPDIQLHFVIAKLENHARTIRAGYGYSCHVCALRPYSRGSVSLHSADPLAAPAIDPNFLSDPRDLASTITGARMARDILMAPAMRPYLKSEMFGMRGGLSDTEWEHHIRARADTIYHPVGTCKMGVDDMAVVDPALKVRGLSGLMVVDASVMPTLIGGNTNAPTMMIAEKAADMIRSAAEGG